MIETSPILITSIPRSGATMIAAAINVCGVWGGTMSKRGMYSNDLVRDRMVRPYLRNLGIDPEGHFPIPDHQPLPTEWRERVMSLIVADGYRSGKWMYKDSRTTLCWKVWRNAFPEAKWVIVRRRTGDVVQSCIKTAYMDAFKDWNVVNQDAVGARSEEEGWKWMAHQYEERLSELTQSGVNHKIIWPERMVQGDYEQMTELCEWLGIEWNQKALDFIGTLLWKKRKI